MITKKYSLIACVIVLGAGFAMPAHAYNCQTNVTTCDQAIACTITNELINIHAQTSYEIWVATAIYNNKSGLCAGYLDKQLKNITNETLLKANDKIKNDIVMSIDWDTVRKYYNQYGTQPKSQHTAENVALSIATTPQSQESTQTPATQPNIEFFAVCGDDEGKNQGKESCIIAFKNINVNMAIAATLAKEYALVRDKRPLTCSNNFRTSWNDDYIKCTSTDNQYFYEFKFDDVLEGNKSLIKAQTAQALCTIYDGIFSYRDNGDICRFINTKTAETVCNNGLKTSIEKFGGITRLSSDEMNACVMFFEKDVTVPE